MMTEPAGRLYRADVEAVQVPCTERIAIPPLDAELADTSAHAPTHAAAGHRRRHRRHRDPDNAAAAHAWPDRKASPATRAARVLMALGDGGAGAAPKMHRRPAASSVSTGRQTRQGLFNNGVISWPLRRSAAAVPASGRPAPASVAAITDAFDENAFYTVAPVVPLRTPTVSRTGRPLATLQPATQTSPPPAPCRAAEQSSAAHQTLQVAQETQATQPEPLPYPPIRQAGAAIDAAFRVPAEGAAAAFGAFAPGTPRGGTATVPSSASHAPIGRHEWCAMAAAHAAHLRTQLADMLNSSVPRLHAAQPLNVLGDSDAWPSRRGPSVLDLRNPLRLSWLH